MALTQQVLANDILLQAIELLVVIDMMSDYPEREWH